MKKPTKRVRSEVAWIAWLPACGFLYWACGRTKNDCLHEIRSNVQPAEAKKYKPVRVRITPLGRGRK